MASEAMAKRVPYDGDDIQRFHDLLLAEKKLSEDSFKAVPKIEERRLEGDPLDPDRVDSITIKSGVNAIKPGAQIDFAPSVTVIFGENGSGKSGFVRALKRAAGLRTAEDILHNVRDAKRESPSASFVVTVGTDTKPLEWNNEFGISPLSRTSIFDSRGARLHVEDDLTYVYSPSDLSLFPIVQSGIERVRTRLEQSITLRNPRPNTLVQSFDRACSIYSHIETLGAATDIDLLRSYAVLPEGTDELIERLRLEIEALSSTNIQGELRRLRDRNELVTDVSEALAAFNAFEFATYNSLLGERAEAITRREKAGDRAFSASGIPGALSGEWRALISAADEYVRVHGSDGYPHKGDSCVYCQQPLGEAAVELLSSYRRFANDEAKAALDSANEGLLSHTSGLSNLRLPELQRRAVEEATSEADPLASLPVLIGHLEGLSRGVSTRTPIDDTMAEGRATAEAALQVELTRLSKLIEDMTTSIETRQAALKDKQSELVELMGKRSARTLMPQIEKRVADAKWASRANIVKNGMSAQLRSLTDAAKDASEELLNKGFERRFQQECKRLRAPNVTLNFPGRQGQVTRRKTVAAYKPSEVLSEGEQKVLALADFLAEVTAIPASSPIVFDDPITSMDYRRIHEVCDRIVDLSASHQVIVFTHNIWFAAELLAKAQKKKWSYFDIRSEDGVSGVTSPASHPRVDTTAQVSNRVQQMIDGARKADGEIRAALVERGYEHLRGLCEIVVEHEVLKGVVQRYAPNVMMTKLEKINSDKLQDSISAILPIFEKACRYIASHSQPLETQGIRPTLEELDADYKKVLAARDGHKE